MISFVVAMGSNHVIGHNNKMPWHLPKDLKHFKETTTGHTIIMGRKTFESIGRPLPNRKNVVITTDKQIDLPESVEKVNDINTILNWNQDNPNETYFIIGGGTIYRQMLPYADRLYITLIDQAFQGDTFFPDFDKQAWKLTKKVRGEKDNKNPYDYYFLQYDRIK
ncbi:MAG TPA: dihydrofolate reductase [Cerasibacillus sp.]|uniref:dihydrofolate reductase n=1 Tax=Cerasibacillus sp. TaxID=2498711 RepID=UPI002F3E6CD3